MYTWDFKVTSYLWVKVLQNAKRSCKIVLVRTMRNTARHRWCWSWQAICNTLGYNHVHFGLLLRHCKLWVAHSLSTTCMEIWNCILLCCCTYTYVYKCVVVIYLSMHSTNALLFPYTLCACIYGSINLYFCMDNQSNSMQYYAINDDYFQHIHFWLVRTCTAMDYCMYMYTLHMLLCELQCLHNYALLCLGPFLVWFC